ncbi:Exostosin domain-containing protein [Cephalotus follicularis]|uniref:Exostosin domain-containing protein n=1 Tax=Cephalotus follicularis TaxID=3775 RepID=A0A1Q3DDC9_CEPFO|nr:Exostosin domain-containing protein [Cephalotus follicularis]
MCPHVENHGLGRPLITSSFSTNWFATHQFIAEMIFHARMENHPCRTWDPNHANLFYVPFYGGLHASSKFRESNHTARDELAVSLVGYLQRQHWWQRHRGKDHFLVLGRTSWDFMRTTNTGYDFGANCLLMLPTVQNMSVLTVERHPWNGSNQHGIPYPSYFHPSTSDQIVAWQNKMRQSERPYLFSFIGAPRRGVDKAAIRDELIKQCGDSIKCMLLKCENGASKCHEPLEVLKVMTESQFCLQAPGDSFTRRSTFDSILSGCIPVFFSPHTAYTQYGWFLPANPNDYSVYIFDNNGNTSSINIEKRLSGISTKRVQQMRSAVIDLIPKLTYAHPNATHLGFQDAVDVSIAALVKHVNSKIRIN